MDIANNTEIKEVLITPDIRVQKHPNSKKIKKIYYIIFDYNLSDNDIIKDNGEYFSKFEDGIQIEIIFIRMKKMSPSKIYKNSK